MIDVQRGFQLLIAFLTAFYCAGCSEQQSATNASPPPTQKSSPAANPQPQLPSANEEFLQKLQGEWLVQAAYHKGDQIVTADQGIVYTIRGNEFIPSDNPSDTATLKVDAAKSPVHVDLTPARGDRRTIPGIVRLSNDSQQLEWTWGHDADQPRPTQFKSIKGSDEIYFTLTRKK
jgi:uncharacterized protein (TIGR03067 family)